MGVAVSPHMTYEMMLNDPHYQAREVFVDCYDEITQKTVKQVNMIPRFKKHPGKIVRGGAKYDADTQDVLEEFGYSEKEIELLYFLASSPNRVFTRAQLLDDVWGL